MTVLLTEEDLRPLVRSAEQIERVVTAIEQSVLDHADGNVGQVAWVDLPTVDDEAGQSVYLSSQASALSLRIFPPTAVSARADSRAMLLMDAAGGQLLGLFAGDELNAMRTSVPAAVGARHLASASSTVLGILGSGDQARSHARVVLRAVPTLERIVVWSPTAAHRDRFAREMSVELGTPVDASNDARSVCAQADVLSCAGRTAPGQAFEADWVKPGSLVLSMTFATPFDLVAGARRFVPAHRRPEVISRAGHLPPLERMPDTSQWNQLSDVIRGASARTSDEEIVVFELAAMYSWDPPLLRWVYEWATVTGAGTRFSLSSPRPD